MAMKASRPKRRRTPASIPEAIEMGTRPIIRSNQPLNPEIVISAAETRKAPIASGIETPAALVINIAAPGVDQAVSTGTRKRSERAMLVKPIPRPRAHIQEAISAGVACSAWAAWKTITAELVKPTRTATKPAIRADVEKSLIRRIVFLAGRAGGGAVRSGSRPQFRPARRRASRICGRAAWAAFSPSRIESWRA